MLPAYNVYYLYAWTFVIYFIVAFYFLLNILLATVFNMFRTRLELKAQRNIQHRIDNIVKFLNTFTTVERGTMTRDEARLFFGEVFDLDYDSGKARKIFRTIMKSLSDEGKEPVKKDDVVGFFAKTGFLDVLHIVESERSGAKKKSNFQNEIEKDNELESFLNANQ